MSQPFESVGHESHARRTRRKKRAVVIVRLAEGICRRAETRTEERKKEDVQAVCFAHSVEGGVAWDAVDTVYCI